MEKKLYNSPNLILETFAANNFARNCSNQTYITWAINCNVPLGYGWKDYNGNGKCDMPVELITDYVTSYWGIQPKKYQGCGEVHENIELPQGKTPQANAKWHTDSGDLDVFVWGSGNSTNLHASLLQPGDAHIDSRS